MSKNLFSAFQPVSKEAWKNKIIKDLKGKDYNESLQWHSEEGVLVEPIYHSEDLEKLIEDYNNTLLNLPSKPNNNWFVLEKVKVDDAENANQIALNLLNEGAEAIEFDCQEKTITADLVDQLTKGILVEVAPISFSNYKGSISFNASKHLSFKNDVISQQLATNQKVDLSQWQTSLAKSEIASVYIDGALYQNAGAKMVEQLAFVLAIANEYFNQLSDKEVNKIKNLQIKLAVGSNFFFEMAKLRAIRKLIKVLVNQYAIDFESIQIEATSTGINKSTLEVYNNMLRNTSECMSAIIGGADVIHLAPHDSLTDQSEKGRRWARNISHILRNESHFDKVIDPANGSYYVEELTDELADKAWQLFKEIEAEGGFLAAWEKGTIQDKITANREEQIEAFKKGKKVILGVNKFADASLEIEEINKLASALAPLRLSAFFE
ncbi:MAG: methylmalonyl-CoA mutase family protein [Chitinophagales bacterium]